MKNVKKVLGTTVAFSAILFLFACNPIENDSTSASLLIVENILGKDVEGKSANYLQSDVITNGSVFADIATASLRADTLDPDPLLGTSSFNDIEVTHYTVSYSRSDGKNTPGVDVPFPFQASLSALVKVGISTAVSFVVVREVAKLEPPLIALADGRAEGVLQVTAQIDFYGHDLANRNVKATGYLSIFFANYVDSGEEEQPPQTIF